MKAIWKNTVMVESNHYFPQATLNRAYVTLSNHKTTKAVAIVAQQTLRDQDGCERCTKLMGSHRHESGLQLGQLNLLSQSAVCLHGCTAPARRAPV
jgi:hypothetical protein